MNHSKLNRNFIHLKYPHYMSIFHVCNVGSYCVVLSLSVDQETQMRMHLRLSINCSCGSQPTMLLLADRSVMKEEVDAGEMEECVIIHQLQLQLLCF
jgi:hypothetical protein